MCYDGEEQAYGEAQAYSEAQAWADEQEGIAIGECVDIIEKKIDELFLFLLEENKYVWHFQAMIIPYINSYIDKKLEEISKADREIFKKIFQNHA